MATDLDTGRKLDKCQADAALFAIHNLTKVVAEQFATSLGKVVQAVGDLAKAYVKGSRCLESLPPSPATNISQVGDDG